MRRKLAALMLAMLLTLTLGAAVLWWLGVSESGLRWILHQAAQASQGALAVHGARGALSGPLYIARLSFEGAALHADVQDLQLDWSPHRLWQQRVAILK
jgi:translocation and assembly module TamB